MDVVRANIERVGGTIQVDSARGEGTRIALSLPLTLSIIPSLTVLAGDQMFAMPRSYVEEIVHGRAGHIEFARAGDAVLVSARELPERGGCYAEAMVVPEDAPFVLPAGLTAEAAVSAPNLQLAQALPPARVEAMYAPEMFGEFPNARVKVEAAR